MQFLNATFSPETRRVSLDSLYVRDVNNCYW